MQRRIISKYPSVPDLTDKQIRLLTELCFFNLPEGKAEVIFVYGASSGVEDLAKVVARVAEQYDIQEILISGGSKSFTDVYDFGKPESHHIHDLLLHLNVNAVIKSEFLSDNLRENAIKLKSKLDHYNSILYVNRSHGTGRSYLTTKTLFPDKKLYQATFVSGYKGEAPITESEWPHYQHMRSAVWGEYLRIKKYGEIGHIDTSPLDHLISQIEK